MYTVQANFAETSSFLSTQMALVSTFFQMFIVLGMYNFACLCDHVSPAHFKNAGQDDNTVEPIKR